MRSTSISATVRLALCAAAIAAAARGQTTDLLEREAKLYYLSFMEDTVHNAIAWNSPEYAIAMLENAPSLTTARNEYRETPLHIAASRSRGEIVKWLLTHGADPNAEAYNTVTPLHLTTNGSVATILIDGGANLEQRDSWGKTPLQSAAQMGQTGVVEAILRSGFPLDLQSALFLGRREKAKRILEDDPSSATPQGRLADLWGNTTPLGIAAGRGDAELVRLLLDAGAPVNGGTEMPNAGGTATPLCNAVWGGHVGIARLLCDNGADCNVVGGKFYASILDFAIKNRRWRLAWILLSHGARPPVYVVGWVAVLLGATAALFGLMVYRKKCKTIRNNDANNAIDSDKK